MDVVSWGATCVGARGCECDNDGDEQGAKVGGEGKKKNSPIEELNLGLNLRKVVCYHYTNRTLVAIRKANFSCLQR